MGKLSFEMSGHGDYPFTLNDVQQLALELGYAKPDVMTNKPLGARVDLKSFFDQYHVKAFSTFKKKFCSEVLKPIGPGGTPMAVKKTAEEEAEAETPVVVRPEDIPPVSKYAELAAAYKGLKWRIISRPGGATMKPANWYRLTAAVNQHDQGDCTTEKPMWAEHGGLDFNGREEWDQYIKLKGMTPDQAMQQFCQVYAEVMADEKKNLRVY